MKKLLCVLMVGMIFGQMKVETRLYTDINFSYGNGINLFNLLDLSDENDNLDYINVQIVNFNINYSNNQSDT